MKHYEWDENKRTSNIEKHKLDFIDAIKIFKDKDAIEMSIVRHN